MSAAQPLPAILRALSGELADLHRDALTLQDVLPGSDDARAIAGLQRLDSLTQTLDALAAYTAGLGEALAAGAPLNPERATRAMPLAALAQRLALRGAAPAVAAGKVDLF